jgi:nitrite reductase (NADH) small subunit
MAKYVIGPINQIPKGEGRVFEISGLRIAVFHTRGGEVFATQSECPHLGGPLADGLIDDATIMCPLHDRVYDLRTGQGIGTDCTITVFPVRVDAAGNMMMAVEQELSVVAPA